MCKALLLWWQRVSFHGMRKDIRTILQRDPAAHNGWTVLFTYPGIHAVAHHRLTHWLWQKKLCFLAEWIACMSRLFTGIEIHPGAKIGSGVFIDHGMGVVIGETAEVGNDCTLYQGVTLGGTRWHEGKRHPTIKDNVIVGAGARILGPIIVETCAKIGSNAVVTKSVPPCATVVGVPGRVIKTRCPDGEDMASLIRQSSVRFTPYAEDRHVVDPLEQTMGKLQELKEEIARLQQRVDKMEQEKQRGKEKKKEQERA